MECGEYIWQASDWPHWHVDTSRTATPVARVARAQGLLHGRLIDIGLTLRTEASLTVLTQDIVKSSAIEGEDLPVASVRSSVARQLGVDIGALLPADRHIDGMVEVILDATLNCAALLTRERLFRWHSSLFQGTRRMNVGAFRDGPIQVVSGALGRQHVHFEGPPAEALDDEMERFFVWAKEDSASWDPLIQAALAHLWFVTLHPFDDGNGRIARAIGDLFLARIDGLQRFYSVSSAIQQQRKAYYDILERTQRGSLDVTEWVLWFVSMVESAVEQARNGVDEVLARTRFWQRWAGIPFNDRQSKVLRRLLDGFEGKLTSSKWASLAKCSPDTALRDLNELVDHGVLQRSASGGRSTSYSLTHHV